MYLAQDVINTYRKKNRIILLCESITAGGIAHALAQIPHASEVLWGSFVLYQSQAKATLLKLDPTLLTPENIASPTTVEAMAKAAVDLYFRNSANHSSSFVCLAISGFADGEYAGKVSCAIYQAENVSSYQWQLQGNRHEVQKQAINRSLMLLLEQP